MITQRNVAWAVLFLLGSILLGSARADESQPAPVYLGDTAADLIVSSQQGWGKLGWNTSLIPPNRAAMPLQIKDRVYRRGLGHHAPGEILVDLSGKYQTFEADLGLQWQGGSNQGSVVFQIFVDDEKRFESRVMRESDSPQNVSIPVEGADLLKLAVTDAGDGITCDCADWADARLIPGTAPAATPGDEHFMDVAPYARVVTSDPKRMQGTRATRTEEFPAEDFELSSEIPAGAGGVYVVPNAAGAGCIGLEWLENRLLRRVGLQFAQGSVPADLNAIQLQYWIGESPWQGEWKRLDAVPRCDGRTAIWQIGYRQNANGIPKVRWVFPPSAKPIVVERFQTITRSRRREMNLALECEAAYAGQPCAVELYNGAILRPTAGEPAFHGTWDTAKPLKLRVRYSDATIAKADRTVLRLTFAHAALAVAVEDLLTHDCVYVPSVGLFAVREPAPVTLAEYRRTIADRKTILDEVRERADQTLAQAMAKTHNPIQDSGPMMLSLACDNRKFVIEREGSVRFNAYQQPDDPPLGMPEQYRLAARFDAGNQDPSSPQLETDWLPILVTSFSTKDLHYQQRSYVAPLEADPPTGAPVWLRDRAVAVLEYEVANPSDHTVEAKLELTLNAGQKAVAWQTSADRYFVVEGERVILAADARAASPLKLSREGNALRLSGALPATAHARLVVFIPAWKTNLDAFALGVDVDDLRAQTIRYWKGLLQPAMQVEVPDPLLTNVLRASQVHCLLAARNEHRGSHVSPWISSDRYGPLESEANSILHGMGLWGHSDFARRGLDFFLKRYNDAGYLTTGYTVVGTGWNLWTLAEYFEQTQDRCWFQQAAPTVAKACQWIVRQRAKTRRLDAQGHKFPGYGLMPPGVSADWNRYAQRFFNDAHYAAGLAAGARALKAIGDPAADELLRDAAAYRDDLQAAFRWTQARSPVVLLRNGVWTTNHPGIVGFFGNVEEFTPGEDSNRSWAASVEIGSHYLPALGLLDPHGPDTTAMVEYLEDHQFLCAGWGDYPAELSQQDPFNLGGFAKVQPYYGRIVEVDALRDDVKPLIRSYFNALSTLLNRSNLSLWEHFHNGGGWNKTHETGWFLAQSRLLFVQERGDELWLAPSLTTAWLHDGMRVKVDRAPTRFGEVSYEIHSSVAKGVIAATVRPPVRTRPEGIVLRLRHPDAKQMQQVFVNSQPYERFDPTHETITLPASAEPIQVRAEY